MHLDHNYDAIIFLWPWLCIFGQFKKNLRVKQKSDSKHFVGIEYHIYLIKKYTSQESHWTFRLKTSAQLESMTPKSTNQAKI